jgi:hypothetical protein
MEDPCETFVVVAVRYRYCERSREVEGTAVEHGNGNEDRSCTWPLHPKGVQNTVHWGTSVSVVVVVFVVDALDVVVVDILLYVVNCFGNNCCSTDTDLADMTTDDRACLEILLRPEHLRRVRWWDYFLRPHHVDDNDSLDVVVVVVVVVAVVVEVDVVVVVVVVVVLVLAEVVAVVVVVAVEPQSSRQMTTHSDQHLQTSHSHSEKVSFHH